MSNYSARVWECVKKALPVAIKTSVWFLKIMLPVSLFVTLLSYFNILPYISSFASPLFTLIGLPGDAALVFVTSIFTNIYTVIALLSTLDFSVRESLIMATMCLISHNFVVETYRVTEDRFVCGVDGDLASLGKFRCGNWFELVAAGNEREDDGGNGGFSRFLGDDVALAGK